MRLTLGCKMQKTKGFKEGSEDSCKCKCTVQHSAPVEAAGRQAQRMHGICTKSSFLSGKRYLGGESSSCEGLAL